jgi:enoyl-CoA hydratase/carnithine racemase
MLTTIKDKLTLYAGLPTVTAIVFSSSSPDFFSSGLETRLLDEKSRRKQLLAAANETSALLKATDRETIALVNGEVDSVVFGVLATAKFRVGTETTKFQVTDLRDGRLPLGGGLAHHLIKSSEHGLAVGSSNFSCLSRVAKYCFYFVQLARYLALSGRSLTAHDLYVLGLLTHVVQQDSPEDTLGIGLGHSFSEE